jgi:hypothetical protein
LAINCIPLFSFVFWIWGYCIAWSHHSSPHKNGLTKANFKKKWTDKKPHWSTNKQTCSNKKKLLLFVASYNHDQNTTRVKEMKIWTLISMLFHRWMIVLISLCVRTLKHSLRKLIKTNIYLLAYFTYLLWLCVSLVVVVDHLTIGV